MRACILCERSRSVSDRVRKQIYNGRNYQRALSLDRSSSSDRRGEIHNGSSKTVCLEGCCEYNVSASETADKLWQRSSCSLEPLRRPMNLTDVVDVLQCLECLLVKPHWACLIIMAQPTLPVP